MRHISSDSANFIYPEDQLISDIAHTQSYGHYFVITIVHFSKKYLISQNSTGLHKLTKDYWESYKKAKQTETKMGGLYQ